MAVNPNDAGSHGLWRGARGRVNGYVFEWQRDLYLAVPAVAGVSGLLCAWCISSDSEDHFRRYRAHVTYSGSTVLLADTVAPAPRFLYLMNVIAFFIRTNVQGTFFCLFFSYLPSINDERWLPLSQIYRRVVSLSTNNRINFRPYSARTIAWSTVWQSFPTS